MEEQFLKNPAATRPDISAAVQAIRFHGEEERRIPKDRLAASLRNLLDRPALADLVIADLARSGFVGMPALVELFKRPESQAAGFSRPDCAVSSKSVPAPEAKSAASKKWAGSIRPR